MHDTLYIIVVQYPLFLFALTVHEYAHAFAADRFGDPTPRRYGRLTLNPLPHLDLVGTVLMPLLGMLYGIPIFGWARPVPVGVHYLSKGQDNIVSLAGVAMNVVAAFLFGLAFRALVAGGVPQQNIAAFFQPAILINLALFSFNLLPIPPLDGSHVLRNILPGRWGERYWYGVSRYGFIILMVLVAGGVLRWIIVPLMYGVLSAFELMYRVLGL